MRRGTYSNIAWRRAALIVESEPTVRSQHAQTQHSPQAQTQHKKLHEHVKSTLSLPPSPLPPTPLPPHTSAHSALLFPLKILLFNLSSYFLLHSFFFSWSHFIFGTPQSLKKSNTTLVGPSPAPGSWMHRFSSSMPSCKTRNSASLDGGLVGALQTFLCCFHADFWHSAEQK